MLETQITSEELQTLAAKKVEERARAKRDPMFLAREVLAYDHFIPEVHDELFACYPRFDEKKPWLEQIKGFENVLVLWARGHLKTTALVVICIQAIICNPDIRILLMQGSINVTRTLLKQIASHFEGTASDSRFKELFPEFCGTKNELHLTADKFTTPARRKNQLAQATVTVASPKSIGTGQHYDLGIFDDLVNDSNWRNPRQLQKIEEDFNMCSPRIDPGCPRWVSGTRYAFDDMYEHIEDNNEGEWVISKKTCWSDDGKNVRFPQHKDKNGELFGFTREGLLQIMKATPGMFASQYLLRPMLESEQVITQEEIEKQAGDPPVALSPASIFIDFANGRDDAVIFVGKVDPLTGTTWLIDGIGGKSAKTLNLINLVINQSIKYRPLKVMMEKSAAGMVFMEYLRYVCLQRNIVLPLEFMETDNKKDAKDIRIKIVAGLVKLGKVRFAPGLPAFPKLVEQFTRYQMGKGHDDYPDTLALMVRELGKIVPYTPPSPAAQDPFIKMIRAVEQQEAWEKAMTEPEEPRGFGGGGDYIAW